MCGCFVHYLRNARASFRGLHRGTDRHCSRLPHRNWPLTSRIITQVTCVKANIVFFDWEPVSETPRTKTLLVLRTQGENRERWLRCGLCSVPYSVLVAPVSIRSRLQRAGLNWRKSGNAALLHGQ